MSDIGGLQGKVTGAVAATGMSSPLWMTWLDGASKVVALVYSILGVIWLFKQIGAPASPAIVGDVL